MIIGQTQKSRPRKLTDAELADVARLGSPLLTTLANLTNKRLTCAHCKRCSRRCEVLEGPALDVGLVEADYQRIIKLASDEQSEAVRALVSERPELYYALRRCCFCGFCTATCQTHMTAPDRMREWRELFRQAGLMSTEDKLVMVDNQWHIFSAYRAIYGVSYPEFRQLSELAETGEHNADVLFFPGCSLVSYAPELIHKVGDWLDEAGFNWAMTDECCGSPLMSQGLFERSRTLREKILDQIRTVGIKQVLTVCPGCGEELEEIMGDEIQIIPLPELFCQSLSGANVRLGEADSLLIDLPILPIQSAVGIEQPKSLTFFDSCHDRFDNRHGRAIRRLMRDGLPKARQLEMEHHGTETLCCGAGGAVGTFDPELSHKRVWRVIDEARATNAEKLVTTCPTCTYTISQARLSTDPESSIPTCHYLELVFDQEIDWETVFAQLNAMWSGEYGPWLAQTFF